MANTRFLATRVEEHIRSHLSHEWGVPFSKRSLQLSTGGYHEFDAVSDSEEVVMSIKTASGRTVSGRMPSGKIKDSTAELYYLSLIDRPTRSLVLTSPGFYEIFTGVMAGKIAPGVDVVLFKLPPEIQAEVDLVHQAASEEIVNTMRKLEELTD